MSYYHGNVDRFGCTADEIWDDMIEQWYARPILQRVNAEILDAACKAANAIARAVYVQVEDPDIDF